MRIITSLLELGFLASVASHAQNQPILGEDTVKVPVESNSSIYGVRTSLDEAA